MHQPRRWSVLVLQPSWWSVAKLLLGRPVLLLRLNHRGWLDTLDLWFNILVGRSTHFVTLVVETHCKRSRLFIDLSIVTHWFGYIWRVNFLWNCWLQGNCLLIKCRLRATEWRTCWNRWPSVLMRVRPEVLGSRLILRFVVVLKLFMQ